MAVVFNHDFTVYPGGGAPLASIDPSWVPGPGAYSMITTSATPRGLRISGTSPGGSKEYSRVVPAHVESVLTFSTLWVSTSDQYSDISFRLGLQTSSGSIDGYAVILSRKTFAGSSGYTRLYRAATQVDEVVWLPNVGQTYNWELQVNNGAISLYRDGVLFLSYTDPSPLSAGTKVFVGEQSVFPTNPPVSDSNAGRLLKIAFTVPDTPAPQDLNPNAVYSESYAVKPILTTTGFLSPAAVYSESYAVKPTLVPVTYPLDVTPVFSRSYAVKPTLSGGPAVLEITPVYSESHVVTPFLATGQVIEPQPVYSGAYAVTPELIPGPAEIELTPVYSLAYVILPTLAMNLTLSPNAVYSESYARKPTLKSRFPCGTIAPLQDRIRAEVVSGGGSSCSVGILGSSEVVKRW